MSSSKPSADSASPKPIRRKAPMTDVKTPAAAPAAVPPTAAKSVAAAPAPKPAAPVPVARPVEPKALGGKLAVEAVKPATKAPSENPVIEAVETAQRAVAPQKALAEKVVKETVETAKLVAVSQKAVADKLVAATAETAKLAAAPLQKSLQNVKPETAKVKKMTEIPTIKGYDEFTAISKANLDALVQANKVFAKGVENISKEVLSLTQSSLESAATAAKAIFAAKTLKDMVELNAEFTRTHFDKLVANSTKLSEMSVKLATDAFAPITARVTVAVEKAVKPAA
jgi:phasin family protein